MKYLIMRTAHHKGGILSRHRDVPSALMGLRRAIEDLNFCDCGCAQIICMDEKSRQCLARALNLKDIPLFSDVPMYEEGMPYSMACRYSILDAVLGEIYYREIYRYYEER